MYQTVPGGLSQDERQGLFDLARAVPPYGVIVCVGLKDASPITSLRAGNLNCILIGIDPDPEALGDKLFAWLHQWPTCIILETSAQVIKAKHFVDVDLVYVGDSNQATSKDLALWSEVMFEKGATMIAMDQFNLTKMAVDAWYRRNGDTWERAPKIGRLQPFQLREHRTVHFHGPMA